MKIQYIPTGQTQQAKEVLVALGRAFAWDIEDIDEEYLREVAGNARHSRSMREDGGQEFREVMR